MDIKINGFKNPWDYSIRLLGGFNFVCFATILFIPFVASSEKAMEAASILYVATGNMSKMLDCKKTRQLLRLIVDFRQSTATFPIRFVAECLFAIDRTFVVTTTTILISYASPLKEVLEKFDDHPVLSACSNNETTRYAAMWSVDCHNEVGVDFIFF